MRVFSAPIDIDRNNNVRRCDALSDDHHQPQKGYGKSHTVAWSCGRRPSCADLRFTDRRCVSLGHPARFLSDRTVAKAQPFAMSRLGNFPGRLSLFGFLRDRCRTAKKYNATFQGCRFTRPLNCGLLFVNANDISLPIHRLGNRQSHTTSCPCILVAPAS